MIKWLFILPLFWSVCIVFLGFSASSDDRLIKELCKKHPIGSDVTVLVDILREDGFVCRLIHDKPYHPGIPSKNTKYLSCFKETGIFALDPLSTYEVYIYSDTERRILSIEGITYQGFQ